MPAASGLVKNFGDLTVLENLVPFGGPRRLGLVSPRDGTPCGARAGRTRPGRLAVRASVRCRSPISSSSSICRALLQEPRVLILDEPTSALPRTAADRLAETTRRPAERGLAVLYISHFLEEVMRVAGRVSVLRDGRTVLAGEEISEVSVDSLVRAMLGGADPAPAARRERAVLGGPSLALTGVDVPGRLREVSLSASGGEIVGLGRDGVMPSHRRLVRRSEELMRRLRIRGGPHDPVARLSGGNQQKVVFAKWLDADPEVIVLDDPTRGVDVGARGEMHRIVRGLADDGKIVLLASSDLTELVDLCDRVLVFQRGRITDEIVGEALSEQTLSLAMNAGFAASA